MLGVVFLFSAGRPVDLVVKGNSLSILVTMNGTFCPKGTFRALTGIFLHTWKSILGLLGRQLQVRLDQVTREFDSTLFSCVAGRPFRCEPLALGGPFGTGNFKRVERHLRVGGKGQ